MKNAGNVRNSIFTTRSTTQKNEIFETKTGFGYPQTQPEGTSLPLDTRRKLYSITVTPIIMALGYEVTELAEFTDQYQEIGKNQNLIGKSMAAGRELAAANIFNFGWNTGAAYLGPDAKPLFATDHPPNGGPTYTNTSGGTSYAYYIVSGAAYPFTAGHDALQLLTEPIPEVGDLMVDVELIAAPTINDCITKMTLSTSANQKGIVGMFTGVAGPEFVPASLGEYVENTDGTRTLFVMKPEFADIYDTYRPIGINAIGEGKINVCGQGGDIEIGDLICSSDMAGKGMKQADDLYHSYTVAKARQNVTFSSPDEVVQIACIYVAG